MEECLLCLVGTNPLLYVVNDKYVDGLIEVDEIIHRVLTDGIGVLHLEQPRAYIQHTHLWIL